MRIFPFTSFDFIESVPQVVRNRIATLRGMATRKENEKNIQQYKDQISKEGSIKIENCNESYD